MWHILQSSSFVLVLLVCLTTVSSTVDKDVQGEINKIAEKLSKFEKPNPVMVGSFIQQIQTYCPDKIIDENVVNNMSSCMDSKFNNSALEQDIREAIPKGELDTVFHDMCMKWPTMKGCLKPLVDTVQDCWRKGDKLTRVMDNMVEFFCGKDNDGARIALFFAEGGMRCVDDQGDRVKECVANSQTMTLDELDPAETTNDDICKSLVQVHDCAHKGLSKCTDPTPENLVTSMLKEVAKSIDCPRIYDPVRLTSSTSASLNIVPHQFLFSSSIFAVAIRLLYSNMVSL